MNKLGQLFDVIGQYHGINDKTKLSQIVSSVFNLTKDRSVYYCNDFAIRFSRSKNRNFSNTVLSLSALQKYDNRPFIVCVVTPDYNHCLIANTTFLTKISHSSQQLMNSNAFTQLSPFGEIETPTLTIHEAASQVGVSLATIRNWIKTGYLHQRQRGYIDKHSFDKLLSEVVGNEKLNSRANKSNKDNHDHANLSLEFLSKISNSENSFGSLGSEYENSLSDSYRNKEGIYYTPYSLVEDLFQCDSSELYSKTFCDPCCGSGNFVMRALELGFSPENIYGYDIDPVAVELTKSRILEKTGYNSQKIIKCDFLKESCKENPFLFDYIYTNPPWGEKIQKQEKEFYAQLFSAGKSMDTASLFFFACLIRLKDNGKIGFLLPEAFFNISTFEKARLKALQLSIDRFVDYGKAFDGLVTKAQAIILTK